MPQRAVASVVVCHESSSRSGPQRPVPLHLIAYRSMRQPTMRSTSYPFYPAGAALAPASRLIYHPDTTLGGGTTCGYFQRFPQRPWPDFPAKPSIHGPLSRSTSNLVVKLPSSNLHNLSWSPASACNPRCSYLLRCGECHLMDMLHFPLCDQPSMNLRLLIAQQYAHFHTRRERFPASAPVV